MSWERRFAISVTRDGGRYEATETNGKYVGRGQSPPEAIADYANKCLRAREATEETGGGD